MMFFLAPLLCLVFFLFFLLILIPLGFTVQALANLLFVPGQLVQLFRDKTLRRNHALEHATVNVIEERFGPTRLGGLARQEGFLIFGGADPKLILEAAREGLRRLKAGETELAIHPRCGTTLVTANLVSAITFLALLIFTGQLSLLNVFLAMMVAWGLARPLSLLLQRYVTTDPRVGNLEIVGLEWERPASMLGLLLGGMPQQIFVRTRVAGRSQVTILHPDEPYRQLK